MNLTKGLLVSTEHDFYLPHHDVHKLLLDQLCLWFTDNCWWLYWTSHIYPRNKRHTTHIKEFFGLIQALWKRMMINHWGWVGTLDVICITLKGIWYFKGELRTYHWLGYCVSPDSKGIFQIQYFCSK